MKMSVCRLGLILLCCCGFAFASLPVSDGLVLHLDASEISGVSDGGAVAAWSDLSGVGNNATQTTSDYQPVYRSSVSSLDSKPAIEFDGTNDWLQLPSTTVSVDSFTVFAVGQYNSVDSNQYIMAGQDGGGDDRLRFAVDTGSTNVFEYRAGDTDWRGITSTADTDVHIFAMTSTVEGFLDGLSVDTETNTSDENPTAFNLGSYNRGEKDFFSGYLAEVIIFNRILTDDELNDVGYYLASKYALDTEYESSNPVVHSPEPSSGSQNIALDAVLQWQEPNGVDSPLYDVYFGTTETFPVLVSEGQAATAFDPCDASLMLPEQSYQWRVDIQGGAEGPVWSFTTRPESIASLSADINEDSIVDMYDLYLLASEWLDDTTSFADINQSGNVNNGDFASLSSSWKKQGPFPSSYVISRGNESDFKIAYDDQVCTIYVDSSDYAVCQVAAECLADDIELVCGNRPDVVNDITGLTGHVIFIGTLNNSSVIDSFVTGELVDVSDVSGQWETFSLEVVDSPVGSVDCGLVVVGSDRRGTAFGVFDLSENMGVSPWYWWADVPVLYREQVAVRDGRYQQGPPSVKYRGIFINDEDWGLHPWSKYTYSPEDEYIGPKTYEKVFELLLRLKANYLWPAMHDCTKAFNAFEENKVLADEYGIVMGSSHCEQMLRNNVWEWYEWSPSDGSDLGSWDWCTNDGQIQEYWEERVEANAAYENVYTTGMRGIHDGSMPCSGATNAEKVQKMEDEIFPAQRQMIADWVNSDPTQVPQIFCPYKEVLTLYNLDMEVPDDITIVWPDDNHGYIRRLSNSDEQARSGRAGVYYHMSYWGSPNDYLWLCSTPPGLIWEEMKKAYDYGADRTWVFNVGDIKPAEICMEYALRLGWDVDQFDNTNVQDYLENWAWSQFGLDYKEQIAEILVEYYRLGITRKPEHMTASGQAFSLVNNGDEAQQRIDAYQALDDAATQIYESMSDIYKDAFYELVLYPVRGANLMNQKVLYAQKSIQYAAQGRASANEYAALAESAYNQIITETDYYNESVADGKWNYMMSYNPRSQSVFNMPSTSTVTPVSGSSMGIIIEGQTSDIADSNVVSLPFADDFSDGNADGWSPTTSSYWEVNSNGNRMEYAINTSDYSALSGDRLGQMSVIEDYYYNNFQFSGLVRSSDDLSSNTSADLAFVFGYTDELNYYYLILSTKSSNSGLYSIVNGTRNAIEMVSTGIPDDEFYLLEVEKTDSGLTIEYNGSTILSSTQVFGAGFIALGSYNDAAAFTEIDIQPLEGSSIIDVLPEFDVFTKQKYFVDIFNKGDTSFTWSAAPSVSWIQLEQSSGTIDTQQRLWIDVDWDLVPLGEGVSEGTVTFSGAGTSLDVKVSAFNPTSPRPGSLSGFVQSNGYVSIEAENYTNKTDSNDAGWEVISTLGSSGDTMTVLPTTVSSIEDTAGIQQGSPVMEYQVYLWDTAEQTVTVYCVPTHAITSEMGLRYAIAFDDQTPQIVDYDTTEWSSQWSLNVLQGAAISESTHTVSSVGSHTLKIWMVDPGVVIDKIVIGDAPTSRLGPSETVISQ